MINMSKTDEFEPLLTLLRIAQEKRGVEKDSYIRTIVRDAQIIRHHPDKTRVIERATYRYSVTLGRSSADFLDRMNALALTESDITELLDFFRAI